MGRVSNAFRVAGLVYRSLPAGTVPGDVGIVSREDAVELVVPGGELDAMEMGLALQPALEAGILSLEHDEGLTIVTVRHGDLNREGW